TVRSSNTSKRPCPRGVHYQEYGGEHYDFKGFVTLCNTTNGRIVGGGTEENKAARRTDPRRLPANQRRPKCSSVRSLPVLRHSKTWRTRCPFPSRRSCRFRSSP